MLHVQMVMPGHTTNLPSLRPGDPPASLTDYLDTGAQLVIISCREDTQGALISISRQGFYTESGTQRLIQSLDYVVERAMGPGETYERPFQTRRGPATLRLRHEVGVSLERHGGSHA